MEDDDVVFSGNFVSCLTHFSEKLNIFLKKMPSRKRRPFTDALVKCCGTNESNMRRWLRSPGNLNRENALRLSSLLELVGYDVQELSQMEICRRNFWELISFGIFNAEKATELIGYSEPASLLKVFWVAAEGYRTIPEDKKELMRQIYKSHRDNLDRKKEDIKNRLKKYKAIFSDSSEGFHEEEVKVSKGTEISLYASHPEGLGTSEDVLRAMLILTKVFKDAGGIKFFEQHPEAVRGFKASELSEGASVMQHLSALALRQLEGGAT